MISGAAPRHGIVRWMRSLTAIIWVPRVKVTTPIAWFSAQINETGRRCRVTVKVDEFDVFRWLGADTFLLNIALLGPQRTAFGIAAVAHERLPRDHFRSDVLDVRDDREGTFAGASVGTGMSVSTFHRWRLARSWCSEITHLYKVQ